MATLNIKLLMNDGDGLLTPRESEETKGLTLVEYRQKLREEDGDRSGKDQEEEEEEEGLEKINPRRVIRNLLLPPGWQQVLLLIGSFRQYQMTSELLGL